MDIPRIVTAFAEWGACMLFVIFLKKRFHPFPLVFVSLLWLFVFVFWQYAAGAFPLPLWPLGMAGAAVLIFLCMFSCCRLHPLDAAYWEMPAFLTAELSASFAWQCYYYLYNAFEGMARPWAQYLFLFAMILFSLAVVYFVERKAVAVHPAKVTGKDVFALFLLGLIAFVVSNLNFIGEGKFDDEVAVKIFEIRTLVDLCGVALLYFYRIQRAWLKSKTELVAMHNVLQQQYAQYCMYKENEEAINRHYHDLKHQLGVILNENDTGTRKKYLEDMFYDLRLHDSRNKTGNEVLDTVLTGKSMECVKDDIILMTVADGRQLSFMSTMDICSLFGNALDNAIESVKKIGDAEKRLIRTAVFSQDDWVVVRVENYFEDTLLYENGAIVTSKSDTANHGYGLKSIRHIAEKYGGSMKIVAKDNWFTLCVLFPREEAWQASSDGEESR